MPRSHPPSPSYGAPVILSADLRVDSGANAGDALGPPDEACEGDYYRLVAGARTCALSLRLAGGDGANNGPAQGRGRANAGEVADGSAVGKPGGAVQLEGRLWLMAPDGDRVETLVLTVAGAGRVALPLSPLRPDTYYVLIAVDARPGPIRLAETVAGAFAAGTRILTGDGRQLPVEALTPGTPVVTRDRGNQVLRWSGAVRMRAEGGHAPVTVMPGVMGNAGPLTVSPNHRLFLYRREARAVAGGAELLIQARHLVDGEAVLQREGGFVTYHSLVFDQHEVIYAEGVPCESLMVCPETLSHLPDDLAAPLQAAFPTLSQHLHIGRELGPEDIARLRRLLRRPDA